MSDLENVFIFFRPDGSAAVTYIFRGEIEVKIKVDAESAATLRDDTTVPLLGVYSPARGLLSGYPE